MPHVIVGTAGHIDHGKTSLVKALTGIDADRLKEEKERGITIDIGFANLELDPETTIGFVDVPGHERFIKNMLAGIGGIDLVMLVVAGDESIMPQTREHFEICSLLHIQRGLTVITKIDAVDKDMADLVEMEVRDFVKGSFLENGPIVRVSSSTGEGIPHLIEVLRSLAAHAPQKDASRIFRLPIDRCFTMHGFGTVVTGTLISGRIRKDEEVEILPSRRGTRVRGIQVHGRPAAEAIAGQRTALNLQGVDVSEVERGMVLTIPGVFSPTSMLDCRLELLPSAPRPIAERKRIRFHAGTAEMIGYAVLLDRHELEPGQAAFVQIRLEAPLFALPGDRFIVRQYSPMVTIGGGVILDAYAEKHRANQKGVLETLRILETGSVDERILSIVADAGATGMALGALAGRTGLDAATLRDLLVRLSKSKQVLVLSDNPMTVIAHKSFDGVMERMREEVRSFHRSNPLVHGISKEELKTRFFAEASPAVFASAVDRLVADKKISVAQEIVHAFGRQVTLGEEEARMRASLEIQFRAAGLQVATPEEVIAKLKIDAGMARKILQLMLKESVLIKVTEDLLFHRASIDDMVERVRELKSRKPQLGVGEFKDLMGVSRKYAIPLLEYLDRQKITRRVGDERVIL